MRSKGPVKLAVPVYGTSEYVTGRPVEPYGKTVMRPDVESPTYNLRGNPIVLIGEGVMVGEPRPVKPLGKLRTPGVCTRTVPATSVPVGKRV